WACNPCGDSRPPPCGRLLFCYAVCRVAPPFAGSFPPSSGGNPVSRSCLWLALLPCVLLPWGEPIANSAPQPRPEPHRSPVAVVALPGGQRALCANHTADSVSLVDLVEGKVLAELACGHKPAAVACSRDGRYAAVSNLWSGTLTLLEVHEAGLRHIWDV